MLGARAPAKDPIFVPVLRRAAVLETANVYASYSEGTVIDGRLRSLLTEALRDGVAIRNFRAIPKA
jgi:hypothetical protein